MNDAGTGNGCDVGFVIMSSFVHFHIDVFSGHASYNTYSHLDRKGKHGMIRSSRSCESIWRSFFLVV